MSALALLYF